MGCSVAIVGAGLTGCLVAHHLSEAGLQPRLFDKSRGRGGRASTRQTPWGQFDLGLPLIPATETPFIAFMENLVSGGLAHQWPEPHQLVFEDSANKHIKSKYFVFDSKMNSACHYWSQNSHFQANSLVTNVRHRDKLGWQLCIEQNWHEAYFDVLVCTTPWPQTKNLLEDANFTVHGEQSWASCWSVGLCVDSAVKPKERVIYLNNNPLQTLIFDSEKPNRSKLEGGQHIWVAHLNHQLSATLGKTQKHAAILQASNAFCQYFNLPVQAIRHAEGHFWRFARSAKGQSPQGVIHMQDCNLIAGGDWSFGASVQSVFKAAQAISEKVIEVRGRV